MDRRILVLVDMQSEFVERSHPLVLKFKELFTRNPFDVIIATEYIGIKNGPIEKVLGYSGPEHDLIVPDILPYVDETVQRCTFCHFDDIADMLRVHNTEHNIPEHVYIAGMDTDIAVLETAMVLVDNRIRPIVLSDYCWSSGGKKYHELGLKLLRRCIGEENIISWEEKNNDEKQR